MQGQNLAVTVLHVPISNEANRRERGQGRARPGLRQVPTWSRPNSIVVSTTRVQMVLQLVPVLLTSNSDSCIELRAAGLGF